jgi:hypothetical protein
MRIKLTTILATCITALAIGSAASHAYAAGRVCASDQDRFAIRTAAVQQQLMVAAYACDAAGSYNKFVVAYRPELQRSDAALKAFFLRHNAKGGVADYHAFKTRLANTSSIEMSRNTQTYCATAMAMYAEALKPGHGKLAAFLDGKSSNWERDYAACDMRTATAGD